MAQSTLRESASTTDTSSASMSTAAKESILRYMKKSGNLSLG